MRHVTTLVLALALGCGGSASSETSSAAVTTSAGDEAEGEAIVASEPVHGELNGVPVEDFSVALHVYPGDVSSLELTSGNALLRLSLPSAAASGVTFEALELGAANAIYTDTTGANLTGDTTIYATVRFGDVTPCTGFGGDWVTAGAMSGDLEVRLVDGAGNQSLLIGRFSGDVRCAPAE